MGESVCWLDRVCEVCGRIDDELDEARRCGDCRDREPDAPRDASPDASPDASRT
jgi:hypothetical protein